VTLFNEMKCANSKVDLGYHEQHKASLHYRGKRDVEKCFYDQELPQNVGKFYLKVDFFQRRKFNIF